jgi:hypothetical protein
MKIDVFSMLWLSQSLLNLVKVIKTFFVGIWIGEGKIGCFRRRITEHMLEIEKKLLCW